MLEAVRFAIEQAAPDADELQYACLSIEWNVGLFAGYKKHTRFYATSKVHKAFEN